VAVVGIADAVREISAAAVAALHEASVEVVMVAGDNEATARRIADRLGIDTVIAEVPPKTRPSTSSRTGPGPHGRHGRTGVNDSPPGPS
jgi:Cu2+-exporting ATPase